MVNLAGTPMGMLRAGQPACIRNPAMPLWFEVAVGLGRIVTLYHRASTNLCQIHEHIR
jgi:hypothetical protein